MSAQGCDGEAAYEAHSATVVHLYSDVCYDCAIRLSGDGWRIVRLTPSILHAREVCAATSWKDPAPYRAAQRALGAARDVCIACHAAPPLAGQRRCEACRVRHNARGRSETDRRAARRG